MSQFQNPRDTRGSSNPDRTTVTRGNQSQQQRQGYAPDTVAEKGKGGKGKR